MKELLSLPFEKYWAMPSSYSQEKKKACIEDAIESGTYIGSLKKDGNMCRFVKVDGELHYQSRNVSIKTGEFTDKAEYVPHISETLSKLPDDTVLIGELYYHGGNSDSVGTILRCSPKKALERQKGEYGWMYYYIHDCWYYGGKDLTHNSYAERTKIIERLNAKYLHENPYIEVPTYARTPEQIRTLLEYALEKDEEGIVLVKKAAIVEPGKRPAWKTLKVKKELHQEIDCFTTGNYKEATELYTGKELETWEYWEDLKSGELTFGKLYDKMVSGAQIAPITKNFYYGWASSIELGWFNSKGEVETLGYVSGIPDEIKEDIVKNNDFYRLKPCTVTAMELTKDGHLRHPKFKGFRDDLPIEDCLKSKVIPE